MGSANVYNFTLLFLVADYRFSIVMSYNNDLWALNLEIIGICLVHKNGWLCICYASF